MPPKLEEISQKGGPHTHISSMGPQTGSQNARGDAKYFHCFLVTFSIN